MNYLILKDFLGNQTGTGEATRFSAGETAALSDHLAAVAVPAGFAKPVKDGEVEEVVEVFVNETPVESRETKVAEPEETKVESPTEKKKKGK